MPQPAVLQTSRRLPQSAVVSIQQSAWRSINAGLIRGQSLTGCTWILALCDGFKKLQRRRPKHQLRLAQSSAVSARQLAWKTIDTASVRAKSFSGGAWILASSIWFKRGSAGVNLIYKRVNVICEWWQCLKSPLLLNHSIHRKMIPTIMRWANPLFILMFADSAMHAKHSGSASCPHAPSPVSAGCTAAMMTEVPRQTTR